MKFSADSIKRFFASLGRSEARHEQAVENALKITALYIQRESQKLAPVDTGVLRNSAGTRTEGKGSKTEAFVFYTAWYAVYVHENLFSYHKPPTKAQFLEVVMTEKALEIRTVFEHAYKDTISKKR